MLARNATDVTRADLLVATAHLLPAAARVHLLHVARVGTHLAETIAASATTTAVTVTAIENASAAAALAMACVTAT